MSEFEPTQPTRDAGGGPIDYQQDVAGGHGDPFAQPRARSRWRGVLLVSVAMAAAFGVGMLIASRTELFPPQVDRGEGTLPLPSAEASARAPRWRGTMVSETSHAYRVGGACRTDWRSAIELTVREGGSVRGRGTAELAGGATCVSGFPTRQPQIPGYAFRVSGRAGGEGLRLRLSDFRATGGVTDYGGFQLTIAEREPVVVVPFDAPDRASTVERLTYVASSGQDASRSRNEIRLACPRCEGG